MILTLENNLKLENIKSYIYLTEKVKKDVEKRGRRRKEGIKQ